MKLSASHSQWKDIFDKCKLAKNLKDEHLIDIIERELFFLKEKWPNNIANIPKGIIHADLFKDNVFFGVGNKNFRWECHMEKYFDASEKYSPQRSSTHPHQVHFELLSEHGLIGYLLIVYLLLKFIFPVFRDSNQDNIYIRKCLVYFLLVFLLPIIPSGSLFSTFNGSYFWLILSILNYLKNI